MSHFAVALLGKGGRHGSWLIEEVDIDSCETIDDVAEVLRDFDQPVRLLAVEQDDEYAVLARLDSSADENDQPMKVFLSNGHSADDYPLAELFADGLEEIGGDPLDGDEDAPPGAHDAAPFGDAGLLKDLGVRAPDLIELAVHEGTLPIDLIEAVCERLGCLDEFEAVRG
jgi:putative tRNA adenosine deaminase-associated protein